MDFTEQQVSTLRRVMREELLVREALYTPGPPAIYVTSPEELHSKIEEAEEELAAGDGIPGATAMIELRRDIEQRSAA